MIETFKKEIQAGLSSYPKTLPSKYFYDKIGDALFTKIMNLPEYYLTRCELDIFQNKTQQLIDSLELEKNTYFELIELGAGDGLKTKELLRSLVGKNYSFSYLPIDISSNALDLLKKDLNSELPDLSVKTRQGDYFDVLASIKDSKHPKIILFLGSNIGNMTDGLAKQFIYKLGSYLKKGDRLLLGVDLIKSKDIILPAYNDRMGITAEFNLNLLERINHELGSNFNTENFIHQPEYDEEEGVAKSFIVSKTDQIVTIPGAQKSFYFKQGEKILTEISRKYNDQIIDQIISKTDFSLSVKITDSKAYFADYLLVRN